MTRFVVTITSKVAVNANNIADAYSMTISNIHKNNIKTLSDSTRIIQIKEEKC